ncbi:MAG: hypothetical protein CBD91_04635 [Phycisphaeraceae bacterium TMED231]|nr:MAG: hypothetical protein CBD91_04635 [Phycisphaeraceae bacterium TMED231]
MGRSVGMAGNGRWCEGIIATRSPGGGRTSIILAGGYEPDRLGIVPSGRVGHRCFASSGIALRPFHLGTPWSALLIPAPAEPVDAIIDHCSCEPLANASDRGS